jgi:hypothetical protein
MVEHNPPTATDSAATPVIPLPVALYVSGELIFELYDGGQPCRRFSIRWERLVQGEQNEREARITPPTPQTGLHTRRD